MERRRLTTKEEIREALKGDKAVILKYDGYEGSRIVEAVRMWKGVLQVKYFFGGYDMWFPLGNGYCVIADGTDRPETRDNFPSLQHQIKIAEQWRKDALK